MEVLECVYRFERAPVLKPRNLLSSVCVVTTTYRLACTYMSWFHVSTKGPLDIVFDFDAPFPGEIASVRILLKRKLCPDHEVDNPLVDSIRPVVEENLDVIWPMFSQSYAREAMVVKACYLDVQTVALWERWKSTLNDASGRSS